MSRKWKKVLKKAPKKVIQFKSTEESPKKWRSIERLDAPLICKCNVNVNVNVKVNVK